MNFGFRILDFGLHWFSAAFIREDQSKIQNLKSKIAATGGGT